jgi:hypothetical protein
MPLRLIGLALAPLLLVLLTVAVSARWALVQLIAIYIWLLPLLVARSRPPRRPPPDRDRTAEWLLAHRAVPFVLYIYVFATLVFGLVAFMASVFGPAGGPSLRWVLVATVVIAVGITALMWRAQVAAWQARIQR